MARRPRHVLPGQAMHLIQRSNDRQAIFFADSDYRFYYEALKDAATSGQGPCGRGGSDRPSWIRSAIC